jgi:hypothetical protein
VPEPALDSPDAPNPLDRIQSGDYVVENGEVPEDLRPEEGQGQRTQRRVQRPATPRQAQPAKGAALPKEGAPQASRAADTPSEVALRRAPAPAGDDAAFPWLPLGQVTEARPQAAQTVAPDSAAKDPSGTNRAEVSRVRTAALSVALAALAVGETPARRERPGRSRERRQRIDSCRTPLGRFCRIE